MSTAAKLFAAVVVIASSACAQQPQAQSTAKDSAPVALATKASYNCQYGNASDEVNYVLLTIDLFADGTLAVGDGDSGDFLAAGSPAAAASVPDGYTSYKLSGTGEDDDGQLDGTYLLIDANLTAGAAKGEAITRDNAHDTDNHFVYDCKIATP